MPSKKRSKKPSTEKLRAFFVALPNKITFGRSDIIL
jgi:hypothetical protein